MARVVCAWDFRFGISQEYITEDQCCCCCCYSNELRKSAKPEPLYCYKRHRIKATNKVFFEELRANAKIKQKYIRELLLLQPPPYSMATLRELESAHIVVLKFDIVKTKRWWKLQSCKIKILHIMSHICYWVCLLACFCCYCCCYTSLAGVGLFIHDCFHVSCVRVQDKTRSK